MIKQTPIRELLFIAVSVWYNVYLGTPTWKHGKPLPLFGLIQQVTNWLYFIFSRKQDLTVHANCFKMLLAEMFTQQSVIGEPTWFFILILLLFCGDYHRRNQFVWNISPIFSSPEHAHGDLSIVIGQCPHAESTVCLKWRLLLHSWSNWLETW